MKDKKWYHERFIPKISPITLIALLFTILVMFSLKGEYIVKIPLDVVRIAVPLLIYFVVMFLVSFFMSAQGGCPLRAGGHALLHCRLQQLRAGHRRGSRGLRHQLGAAFAAVIGPLVEVPVLINLVHLSLWFKRKYFPLCEGNARRGVLLYMQAVIKPGGQAWRFSKK